MKPSFLKITCRIALLHLALLLGQTKLLALGTLGFSLTPSTVSNTYSGTIALVVSNVSIGGSVVVQKYLDINSDGMVDAGDMLVQQFTLTDGQPGMVIGGVTNVDVPGDTDGAANHIITATLRFKNGDFTQNIVAHYIYVVYSPTASVTNTFLVTNVPYAQKITGVVSNGGPVGYAVVLLFPPPRAGHNGPGGSPTIGVLADNSGNYTAPVPVGSYTPVAFGTNAVSDSQNAAVVTVSNNATVTDNLTLTTATNIISGQMVDATNGAIVLPGVFEPAKAGGFLSTTDSDTNGYITFHVTPASNWGIGSDDKGLIVHGYVGYNNGTNVDTTSGNVTNQTFFFSKATALFYGTVRDTLGNPMVGVDISDQDGNGNGEFSQDAYTDANGYYVLGALGSVGTNDGWYAQPSSDSFTNYIFSTPDVETNGNITLTNGQVVQANFVGLLATNTISGNVNFHGTNVVGVGVTAYATINGTNFNLNTSDTDSNGDYSLTVGNGNWTVFVFCSADDGNGNDNLTSILPPGTSFECPGNTNVLINNTNATANFTIISLDTFLAGQVTDDQANAITNMNVYAIPTNGGSAFQATTDSNGNFQIGVIGGSYLLQLNNDPNSGFPALGLVGPSVPITITGGTTISNILLIAPQITGAIQVQVNNPNNAGVPGIGAWAMLTNGITNYMTEGQEEPTDGSGAVTLPVFNGNWEVNVDGNNVQNLGYIPPVDQPTTVTSSTNTVTFTLVGGVGGLQLQASSLSMTNGLQGQFFTAQIQISGGIPFTNGPPYVPSLTNGSLPPGLNPSFSNVTTSNALLILSGTPTNSGSFPFTAVFTDSVGDTATNSYSITINPASAINVIASPPNGGTVSGGGEFATGGTNTVMATPTNGYLFVNWMSNSMVVSSNANYSFLLATDVTLVANFTPGYTVSVNASPSADGTVGGGGTYMSNAPVLVTANPTNGYAFVNWTSNSVVVSSNASYGFNISTNVTLTAHFAPLYSFTVADSPSGSGLVSPGQTNVVAGTPITVTATNNSGFVFTNWTSNNVVVSTSTNYGFSLNTNVALVANFLPLFSYTVAASPGAEGTVSSGNSNIVTGTSIMVTATNSPGYAFINWTSNGTQVSTVTNYTFTLNTNVALVATFEPTYTVTVSASPGAGGIVTSNGTFTSNTVVSVTAANNPGYMFTNWTSNSVQVSTTTNYSFTLTTDVTLVANFILTPAAIEVFNAGNALTNNQTNAVGFPNVQSNQPGPIVSFTVSNAGGLPLTISNISLPTNFVLVTNAPATLTNFPTDIPGLTNAAPTNGVFSVQLLTGNLGVFAGTIVITNDNTNFSFPITGTVGGPAPVMAVLDGTNVITNRQAAPVVFATTLQNQPGSIKVFTVTNPGLLPLNVSNITVPAGYTLTTNSLTNIPAGSNGTFSVQLDTATPGVIAGNITITNNDTNNDPFVFPVSGTVAAKIISLSGNLAFGIVPSGSSANLTLTISNLGNTNLTVSNITYPTGFSGAFAGVIAPSNSQAVTVKFSPTAATNYGGTAIVGSDATSGNASTSVSGFGGNTNSLLLVVITNGSGTVAPVLTAKALVMGRKYTLTATAKPNNVFSNWSGSTNATKNVLTFTMEPGTILEANFITNPFIPVKGTYNGLFSATNGIIDEQTAGMLKGLTVATKGTYSGTLLINGVAHGLSGTFNLAGQSTNKVVRPSSQGGTLWVMLNLLKASNSTPVITGTIYGTNTAGVPWVSTNLIADLASNLTFSSDYTIAIPPDTNNPASNSIPGGDGYALITNHIGAVKITGALADGTAFSQSVPASQALDVPVYASLYGNKGMLLGWINLDASNAPGTLYWVHQGVKTGLFKNVFTSTNPIELSPWTNLPVHSSLPTNLIAIEITNGLVTQTNAYIIAISNNFKLGKVSGPLPLSGSINPKTGQVTVTLGGGESKQTGYGVVLLNGTNGGGYFVTKTNSGAILLKP